MKTKLLHFNWLLFHTEYSGIFCNRTNWTRAFSWETVANSIFKWNWNRLIAICDKMLGFVTFSCIFEVRMHSIKRFMEWSLRKLRVLLLKQLTGITLKWSCQSSSVLEWKKNVATATWMSPWSTQVTQIYRKISRIYTFAFNRTSK